MLDFGYYCQDCMIGMKEFPDKYFDLAVVDPPYGNDADFADPRGRHMGGGRGTRYVHRAEHEISNQEASGHHNLRGRFSKYDNEKDSRKVANKLIEWDIAPDDSYFEELFRVSKNQIIWGGNYFSLPPTRCFLVWEKTNIPENFSMSMCEYAWCSFNDNAKIFKFSSGSQKGRFHPTAKPVELYNWIFSKYTKRGDKILDTHVGSASSLIAAYDAGLNFVGFEIDEYYYNLSKQRLEDHMAQHNMFQDFPEILGGDNENRES